MEVRGNERILELNSNDTLEVLFMGNERTMFKGLISNRTPNSFLYLSKTLFFSITFHSSLETENIFEQLSN